MKVNIKHDGKRCSETCDLYLQEGGCNFGYASKAIGLQRTGQPKPLDQIVPSSDCPGEGEYELVLKPVEAK